MDWRARAECRNADPEELDAFFPCDADDSPQWVESDYVIMLYCDLCPVRDECLKFGEDTDSVGVWGGRVLHHSNDLVPGTLLDRYLGDLEGEDEEWN